MIIDSFDRSEPIITPEDYYGPQKHIVDTCIITLSSVIFREVLEKFDCRKEAEIGSCAGNIPIYTFVIPGCETGGESCDIATADETGGSAATGHRATAPHSVSSSGAEGKRIGILLCSIGSVAAGINITEANWLIGATNFIMFGSAGSLDQNFTTGKYVIPTQAYRDEGMSYHYVEPSDYIEIPGARLVKDTFASAGVPFVEGPIWSTDTWYRETRRQFERRKSEGCIAVDMEVAGAQAVCEFYGWNLYCFLVTGDVLDAPAYSVADLYSANHDLDKLYLALEIAKKL